MKKVALIGTSLLILVVGSFLIGNSEKLQFNKLFESNNLQPNSEDTNIVVSENKNQNFSDEVKNLILATVNQSDNFSSAYKTPINNQRKNNKIIQYEDEWCIASEELSEDDFYRAKIERKEWLLSRGMIFLSHFTDDNEDPLLNSEYLKPYEATNNRMLWELGQQGDQFALIALLQNSNVTSSIRSAAARMLVIHGDTAMGLQQIVMDELNNARFLFS
ncbi:MAG: hypothetical protein GW763_18075 [Paraglaciecola sp.]|nr:hypothetical protein [Paraglaciecola sp.]